MVSLPYRREVVEVTQALARSAEGSFPVAGIGQIETRSSFHPLTLLGIFGIPATLGTVLGGAGFAAFLGLLAATVLCFYLGNRWKRHEVIIGTSTGTRSVFLGTRDRAFAAETKQALETAISARG